MKPAAALARPRRCRGPSWHALSGFPDRRPTGSLTPSARLHSTHKKNPPLDCGTSECLASPHPGYPRRSVLPAGVTYEVRHSRFKSGFLLAGAPLRSPRRRGFLSVSVCPRAPGIGVRAFSTAANSSSCRTTIICVATLRRGHESSQFPRLQQRHQHCPGGLGATPRLARAVLARRRRCSGLRGALRRRRSILLKNSSSGPRHTRPSTWPSATTKRMSLPPVDMAIPTRLVERDRRRRDRSGWHDSRAGTCMSPSTSNHSSRSDFQNVASHIDELAPSSARARRRRA